MDFLDDRPWARSYAPGVPLDIEIPEESLVDVFESSVRRFGDHIAMDFFGATTTYRELGDQVARAAGVLSRLGVEPGDRVALVLPNCPQHVVAFYAVERIGAVVVEHNPLYTADEMAFQLGDHHPRLVIAWDKVASMVSDIATPLGVEAVLAVNLPSALPWAQRLALRLPLAKTRTLRAAMTADAPGVRSWEKLLAAAQPLGVEHPRPAVNDVAVLQYTGGTTGKPKAAVLTHRNLRANAAQGVAWLPGLAEGEEVIYAVLPLFHVYGLTLCLTFAVEVGATLVLLPRFDVDHLLSAMRRRPATFLPAVPPIYQRVATAARERGVDLSSIRYAISGAMPLPEDTADLWESVTGHLLIEGYGMTETSPVALGNPDGSYQADRHHRRAVPVDRGARCRSGRPDRARATRRARRVADPRPAGVRGYWERPDETARVILPDGWIRTGDVVVMDRDGFFTIGDRIKELIITGGFNVYPSEVEEALRHAPGVADAAVVGLPESNRGEQVVAAVVPRARSSLRCTAAVRSRRMPASLPRAPDRTAS